MHILRSILETVTYSTQVREYGFRNPRLFACEIRYPRNFCLQNQESWALESGIQLKESGIHRRLVSGIQVSWTKNPESSTGSQESTAWNPESKTLLDFLTRVETNAKPWEQTECITGAFENTEKVAVTSQLFLSWSNGFTASLANSLFVIAFLWPYLANL